MTGTPTRRRGADAFQDAWRLAAMTWVVMAVQELFLFLRPTPYGGPYVQQWWFYLSRALFYNLLGVTLVALPFLLRWLAAYRRQVDPARIRRWHRVELGVLVLTAGLDHADNEVMRFLGTHLTWSLLRTYEKVGAWGSDMLHVFTTDRGGPGLPFVLLGAGMFTTWWLGRRLLRNGNSAERPWPLAAAIALAALPLAVPFTAYNLPGAHFPRNRVRPEVVTLLLEAASDSRSTTAPADLPGRAAEYQSRWLATSGDSGWSFPDPRYPMLRVPRQPAAPDSVRWNVIYLQLETFRGWDMGFLRPGRTPSPTPYLDSLAADRSTALWTRFLSFGPPTVSGFMAGHCSAPPHSTANINTSYTGTSMLCLPDVLRRHGWHTAYFTGSDPDWDNQTIWLRRWYDELEYYPDADELDRAVFSRALTRIRALGREPQPFMATVVSISNHYPFRSRDSTLDLNRGATPAEAVLNTIHYTDRVVGEFLDSLAREPWYAHTLVVIVGDHGYNLGEHDGTPGQRNGWRESLWVPFLIHGAHPRLVPGRHDGVASQLDIAPTVAELLGIRDSNPWPGRNLLAPGPGGLVGMRRADVLFAETPEWSMVLDPGSGVPHLYDPAADPLQQRDLAGAHGPETAALERAVRREQELWDYLVESDRLWPATGARR